MIESPSGLRLQWTRHRSRRADRAPGRGRAGACPSSRLGRTGRFSLTRSLHLSGILEPLLIFRRLLPALVRSTGADQVHVGPQVLAVLARFEAGAVSAKAEVFWGDLVDLRGETCLQVAALVANRSLNGARFRRFPEFLPLFQTARSVWRLRHIFQC